VDLSELCDVEQVKQLKERIKNCAAKERKHDFPNETKIMIKDRYVFLGCLINYEYFSNLKQV